MRRRSKTISHAIINVHTAVVESSLQPGSRRHQTSLTVLPPDEPLSPYALFASPMPGHVKTGCHLQNRKCTIKILTSAAGQVER